MLTVQSWVSSPKKLFCLFQLSQPQLFTKLNKEPFIDTRPLSEYLPEQSATGSQSSGHRPLPPTLRHSFLSPPTRRVSQTLVGVTQETKAGWSSLVGVGRKERLGFQQS